MSYSYPPRIDSDIRLPSKVVERPALQYAASDDETEVESLASDNEATKCQRSSSLASDFIPIDPRLFLATTSDANTSCTPCNCSSCRKLLAIANMLGSGHEVTTTESKLVGTFFEAEEKAVNAKGDEKQSINEDTGECREKICKYDLYRHHITVGSMQQAKFDRINITNSQTLSRCYRICRQGSQESSQ